MMKLVRLAAVCSLLSLAAGPSLGQEYVLRLAFDQPPGSPLAAGVEAFKAEAERASEGALTIELLTGEGGYREQDLAQAVGSGAVEMALLPLKEFEEPKVSLSLLQVPVVFDSAAGRADALAPGAPLRSALDKEVRRLGGQALWWPADEPGLFQAARASARLPGELAGRPVATTEAPMVSYIAFLRGVPLPAPRPDTAPQFKMSRLSALDAPDGADGMNAHRITGYSLGAFVLIVNLRYWNELPRGVTEALRQASEAAERQHSEQLEAEVQQTLANAQALGFPVEPMTARVQAQWRLRAWELWTLELYSAKERGTLLQRAAEWMRNQTQADIEASYE